MTQSLCEICQSMREVISAKGSRFLLCRLSQANPNYPKYPSQPIVRCEGFQSKENAAAMHGKGCNDLPTFPKTEQQD